jgi:hypothetical protein
MREKEEGREGGRKERMEKEKGREKEKIRA